MEATIRRGNSSLSCERSHCGHPVLDEEAGEANPKQTEKSHLHFRSNSCESNAPRKTKGGGVDGKRTEGKL